jgi:DNA-binding MarR family transcriptional regulator
MNKSIAGRDLERQERVDYVAGNLLSRAALLVRLLVKQVRDSELSRTEGEVLAILADGPRRITELAELEGLAQPTMTLLVKRLESSGWVTRAGLAHDGRVVMVTITDAGHAMVQAFRMQFVAALRDDLQSLGDRELAALAKATATLDSFVATLQRQDGDEGAAAEPSRARRR